MKNLEKKTRKSPISTEIKAKENKKDSIRKWAFTKMKKINIKIK